MGFKSRKPPEVPQLPQQQALPELMDIYDEISGYKVVTKTGPDGKKSMKIERSTLTPEEQRVLKQADNLMAQATQNIETLYHYNPNDVVDFQPFIQEFANINQERIDNIAKIGDFSTIRDRVNVFRNMNMEIFNQEFDKRERMVERDLNKRGWGDSSYAAAVKANLARERSLGAQQADIAAAQYGEDMMQQQLNKELQLNDLQERALQARLQKAGTGYELERQKLADEQGLVDRAMAHNVAMLNTGQQIKGAENDKARLALAGAQLANNTLATQGALENQRTRNEMDRLTNQYSMDLARYKNTQPRFGDKLLDLGLATAANAGGSYLGSKLPGYGKPFGEGNLTDYNNWVNPNKKTRIGTPVNDLKVGV